MGYSLLDNWYIGVFSCYAKRFWHLDSVAETLLLGKLGLDYLKCKSRLLKTA